jgi:hypothetical protein
MKSWPRLSALALAVCCLAPYAAAQDAAQSVSVLQVEVRPGSQGAFEEFVRHYKAAADKVGTTPSWYASSPAIGPTTMYSFSRPFSSFRELADPGNPMAAVYSTEEIARLQEVFRASVVASRTMTYDVRPDLSRPRPSDAPEPEVAIATLIEVKPGKAVQFEIYAKKVREATSEVAPQVYWTMFAPDIAAGTTYAVWAPTTWAALDNRPSPIEQRLLEAFGRRQGQEIHANGMDAIVGVTSQLRRVRPDLSHDAAAAP